jgi:hypothetical protein
MNSQFTISWSDMFSSDQYLYYEISAGSHEAGVNILQWQFTNETSVTFGIPLSVKLETGFNVLNCPWRPCLLMDRTVMSNLNRGPSIDASCKASIHLA